MENSRTVKAAAGDAGERLDSFLSRAAGISRSAAAHLAQAGLVCSGGEKLRKNYRVSCGEEITYTVPDALPCEAEAEEIPLDIVYEDDDIIIVCKPAGMVVHPAAGNSRGTLVNALLAHCGSSLSGIGGKLRPGIVHRIDKDTSGLLAAAKNDMAHTALSRDLAVHAVSRVYYAIAVGTPREESGTVDAPIGRHPTDRKKMAVVPESSGKRTRRAVTHYKVLERLGQYSLLRLELETGRTHQIRVHMAYIGHPLFGDVTYGGGHTPAEKKYSSLHTGQYLFAGELRLRHPRTGEDMTFTHPLPDYFTALLARLRADAGE